MNVEAKNMGMNTSGNGNSGDGCEKEHWRKNRSENARDHDDEREC